MKLPISQRLLACCSFVRPGDRVADVGCDHGYLGIHLLQTGIATQVYASDINRDPLQSAIGNAISYGTADRMRFFLCPGLTQVPRDFDVVICAGMGADTILSILDTAPWLQDTRYRLILQCQSKLPQFRRGLSHRGYSIRQETLVRDGKYIYPVLEAVYAPGEPVPDVQCYISRALLDSGSPLLAEYLERILTGLRLTVDGISRKNPQGAEYYRAILSPLEELMQTLQEE